MHLGDIYYSGDEPEVRDRFLKFWPHVPGAISRALNGNHEMYTGGKAYFDHILTDQMFNQPASYCAFQNGHWLLVGLDSAYKDHDLREEQLPWLNNLLTGVGSRRVVVFSHHQPFSQLDKQGPRLQAKLMPLLSSGRIFAWYWGHEHLCVVYHKHERWNLHGRCVGHSGYPYFRPRLNGIGRTEADSGVSWVELAPRPDVAPGALVLDGPNPYVPGEEEKYGAHGYVTLEFDGPRLREIFHLADGTRVRTNDLA